MAPEPPHTRESTRALPAQRQIITFNTSMQFSKALVRSPCTHFLVGLVALFSVASLSGQQTPPVSDGLPQPMNWTAAEDHQNMMDQLGIKTLRPVPSANERAPNHANYEESKAQSLPQPAQRPDLKNGRTVATAEEWWKQRRPRSARTSSAKCWGACPRACPR
jgi:hypothetical protein